MSDTDKQMVALAGVCFGEDDSSSTDSNENGYAGTVDIFGNEMVDSFGDGGVWSALMAAPRGGVGGRQTLTSSWKIN